MNKSIILKLILLFAVLSFAAAFSVLGQPNQYPYQMAGQSDQYPYNMAGQQAQYSDQTPGNAPIPANPTTPESLGMQTPTIGHGIPVFAHSTGEIPRGDNINSTIGLRSGPLK